MDVLISFLFENTYVHLGLLLVLVYVLYTRFLSGARIKGTSGFNFSTDDLLRRVLGTRYAEAQTDRAVAREKKRGNFLGAGRLYEDAGKLPQAVEAYTGGQEYYAAASVLERMGKLEKSAEMFLQAGDYKKAAQVLTQAGKPGRAATLSSRRGTPSKPRASSAWPRTGHGPAICTPRAAIRCAPPRPSRRKGTT